VLDRVNAGFDGVIQRVAAVDVYGDGNSGAVCFIDRGAAGVLLPLGESGTR